MDRKTTSLMAVAGLAVALLLAMASCRGKGTPAAGARTAGATPVDIVYLNHPPVLPVLTSVGKVLDSYDGAVAVTRYDFDTPEGQAFAKKKRLSSHVPLAIFINGSQMADLDGRKVTFESFPKGQGTGMVPDGEWSMEDLDAALKTATRR